MEACSGMAALQPSMPHAQPLDTGAVQLPSRITLVVNGILNPRPGDARRSAEHLANTFAIPTNEVWYFHIKDDLSAINPAEIDERGLMFWAKLGGIGLAQTGTPGPDRLKEDLEYFLSRGCSVDIHCHSRGAYATHEAAKQLTIEQRKLLSITSYGGVSLIPLDMARSVTNIVNLSDQAAEMGRLALSAAYPESTAIRQSERVYHWLEHVCLSRDSPEEILSSTGIFTHVPTWLEMTMHNLILPTIRVQQWTTRTDMFGHQFTSYIDRATLPPCPVHNRFEEVYGAGILAWMASVAGSDAGTGAQGRSSL